MFNKFGGRGGGTKVAYFYRMQKLLIISLLLIIGANGFGQNLVPDPSFEEYKRCPTSIIHQKSEFRLNKWYPARGSTDYYNSCANHKRTGVSVPYNQSGNQNARTGNGYVGFLSAKFGNEREYLGAELIEPLINGEKYYVEFWISLADYSIHAAGRIGAYFSKDKISDRSLKPLKVDPQIMLKKAVLDTTNWVRVSGEFLAKGDEKFITIGSFSDKSKYLVKTGRKKYPKYGPAYYFIDDVMVRKATSDSLGLKSTYFESEKEGKVIQDTTIIKN
jgi:OOP family OmpA-OmpF porin